MVFVACGLNHKTAPVAVREKIAPDMQQQGALLLNLVGQPCVSEAAMLATCNRTEIYCTTADSAALLPWMAQQYGILEHELKTYTYLHQADAGVRHTMRVACGLDSMMLGEPQILGQMKQAYNQACDIGAIGNELRHLFRHVFSASKKVRSHTDIGVNPISIAFAAVNLIRRNFADFTTLQILLIGAGDTSKLVAKYLQQQGAQHFYVANRTKQHAQDLASSLGGKGLSINDIATYLPRADLVISATACPLPFIGTELVAAALKARQQRPMFLLDLAVPRDIEPEVGDLDHISLYNIDDLQQIVTTGLSERRDAARQAEQIIELEIDNYGRWQRSLSAATAIRQYRDHMQQLHHAEVARATRLLQQGQDPATLMAQLSQRLINKLIHRPTIKLRQAGDESRHDVLELIKYLYSGLDDPTGST